MRFLLWLFFGKNGEFGNSMYSNSVNKLINEKSQVHWKPHFFSSKISFQVGLLKIQFTELSSAWLVWACWVLGWQLQFHWSTAQASSLIGPSELSKSNHPTFPCFWLVHLQLAGPIRAQLCFCKYIWISRSIPYY